MTCRQLLNIYVQYVLQVYGKDSNRGFLITIPQTLQLRMKLTCDVLGQVLV